MTKRSFAAAVFRNRNHTHRPRKCSTKQNQAFKTKAPKPTASTSYASTSRNFTSLVSHARTRSHSEYRKKPRRIAPTSEASRKWVFSSRDFSNYEDKVVFVSYNILGVENASKHGDLYYRIPKSFLDWDCRKKLICEEIKSYNPSVISFQEVDRFDDLENLLCRYGFRGVYQARTGEAHDGCAIFWKDDLFTLLHEENIEFKRFGLRDNVAQFCVLKMIKNQTSSNIDDSQVSKEVPCRSLLVGNIHVLFNPNRGDIKLGQTRIFLEKAHELSVEWGNIPTLLGGDLNSLPQSALYQFLASAKLDIQLHQRKNISGQICPLESPLFRSRNIYAVRWSDEETELATGTRGVVQLRHNLKLSSAYHGVPGSSNTRDKHGEPLATTYHSRFMGTVDYIWHTKELVPVRVLETLPTDILMKTGGLPSKKWGSDHLALVCELAFVDDS